MKYDFSGYATKNDLECSDGRIIRSGAFKDDDGTRVPLVWNHNHDTPSNVIGHAQLENRPEGVYAYCSFNNTEPANHSKELLRHGDIASLSILANKIKQNGREVVHGCIREVSLVLAGANPGATIKEVCIQHSDGTEMVFEDEAVISYNVPLHGIKHSEEFSDEKKEEDMNKKRFNDGVITHADIEDKKKQEDSGNDNETIEDVFNTLTDKQKNVVYYLIAQAADENGDEEIEEIDEKEVAMKHNIFDNDSEDTTIAHSDILMAIEEAPRVGTMSEAFIKHGIDDIDILFPEAKTVTPTPDMITRQMGWVDEVLNSTKKSPFSRIKSVAANLTEDEARAKGYIKGKEKVEEQFGLLKRVTTPQTIYKKQSLDRDDIIDITDFDVVAWLKAEMKMMLHEEIARAVLVSDGRSKVAEDKIKEDNVRPIYQDVDTYTIHYKVNIPSSATNDEKSEILVDSAVRSRKDYRGSGNPVLYASTDVINDMLLARDDNRRRMYNNEQDLAAALRVSKIVEVPVFDGVTRTDEDNNKFELLALIVNLADYTIGSDKGGEVNFFDDFDIDFNKEKYLIETRISGALTHPYSAIALEKPVTTSDTPSQGGSEDTPSQGGSEIQG